MKEMQLKPDFLDMVPWYSGYVPPSLSCVVIVGAGVGRRRRGCFIFMLLIMLFCRTSADLFKTVFDLLVSVTVFVGRFDMRMMQVGCLAFQSFL